MHYARVLSLFYMHTNCASAYFIRSQTEWTHQRGASQTRLRTCRHPQILPARWPPRLTSATSHSQDCMPRTCSGMKPSSIRSHARIISVGHIVVVYLLGVLVMSVEYGQQWGRCKNGLTWRLKKGGMRRFLCTWWFIKYWDGWANADVVLQFKMEFRSILLLHSKRKYSQSKCGIHWPYSP